MNALEGHHAVPGQLHNDCPSCAAAMALGRVRSSVDGPPRLGGIGPERRRVALRLLWPQWQDGMDARGCRARIVTSRGQVEPEEGRAAPGSEGAPRDRTAA